MIDRPDSEMGNEDRSTDGRLAALVQTAAATRPRRFFMPAFSHGHYHSFQIQDGQLAEIHPILRQRAEEIALVVKALGASSVIDVGCNFGGFLFYLEAMSGVTQLMGIDGEDAYIQACRISADNLASLAGFITHDFMQMPPPKLRYDVMLLQNVYHYIYDVTGNHEDIFRKCFEYAKAIIWYNPMDASDPVIPQHAMSRAETDWARYNRREIFSAAIKAGYLHPIPLGMRFDGMGKAREHWLFIADEISPAVTSELPVSDIRGLPVPIAEHYQGIHSVHMDEAWSYKVFYRREFGQMDVVRKALRLGVYDHSICGEMKLIMNDGECVGYAQRRGIDYFEAAKVIGSAVADRLYRTKLWQMFSRMIRHDVFNHDIGQHNFVFSTSEHDLHAIDLEGLVFDSSTHNSFSIYQSGDDPAIRAGVLANLAMLFPDIEAHLEQERPADVLWDCLARSNFLSTVSWENAMR